MSKQKTCAVLTAHIDNLERMNLNINGYDTLICTDAGLLTANILDRIPDILIGDYDSLKVAELNHHTKFHSTHMIDELSGKAEIITLPVMKDVTDTEAALDLAVERGYSSIDIIGGLGGRLDHTLGNLALLSKYAGTNSDIIIADGQNKVFMLTAGRHFVKHERYTFMSLVPYGGFVHGLKLKGTKYLLDNHTLIGKNTLGISNEIIAEHAEISFEKGQLLVVLSSD